MTTPHPSPDPVKMSAPSVKSSETKTSATDRMNPPENTIEMLPASAPSTNAYKTERFDEDNLKAILQDERYAKSDRLRLGLYFKTKRSGAGTARVKYVLGKNYTEHNLGRLLPENGLGLQNFRWDMRNPLVHKYC